MDDVLRLVGGLLYLVLAVVGSVFGWRLIGRLRRWQAEQQAAMPAIHAQLVEQRRALSAQAVALDQGSDAVTGRLQTGTQDLAVILLSRLFGYVTGRQPAFWMPILVRMAVGGIQGQRNGHPDGTTEPDRVKASADRR